jgi:hypothetical protein
MMARLALSKKRDIGRWATLFSGWASARRKKVLLVAFDADPIAAARDGNRGGVDDIADRESYRRILVTGGIRRQRFERI